MAGKLAWPAYGKPLKHWNVRLTEETIGFLKAESERRGISVAEYLHTSLRKRIDAWQQELEDKT